MDFGDILSQWDDLCLEERRQQKNLKAASQAPRRRLPNAPEVVPDSTETEVRNKGSAKYKSRSCANQMDIWLRRYGVIDKDAEAEQALIREQSHDRVYLKNMIPGAKIDLHGLTRDEAWTRLDEFVTDCSRRGIGKILIVHGKGNHSREQPGVCVLSEMVRSFIECDSRLGTSGHPDKKQGGNGATWVIIKKNALKTL